jgi:hypothetical protein
VLARYAALSSAPAVRAGLGYAACALFSLGVFLVAAEPVHRLWGGCGAVAYGCAALASLAPAVLAAARPPRAEPGRRTAAGPFLNLGLALALAGAVVVPLCWLAATGRAMPEVWVVVRSASHLVKDGRPYESAASIGASVYGYNPYLPGMTLFGLPRALLGGGVATDPRIWDAAVFAAAFGAALRFARGPGRGSWTTAARGTALLVASPLIAFPLAVSGNDLPVIGLLCLGLALAASPAPIDPAWTGIVLGTACALKATAWPALLIVGVLLFLGDRRAVTRFAGSAAAVLALVAGPFLFIQPADFVANTVKFPLGLTSAPSPAASPLPGHLMAAAGPVGHLAAIAALAVSLIALCAMMVARPPRTAVAATVYLALVLTALFTFAPATRWGYFGYPASLGCWLWLSGLARRRPRSPEPERGARHYDRHAGSRRSLDRDRLGRDSPSRPYQSNNST